MLEVAFDDAVGRKLAVVEHRADEVLVVLRAVLELVLCELNEGDDARSRTAEDKVVVSSGSTEDTDGPRTRFEDVPILLGRAGCDG